MISISHKIIKFEILKSCANQLSMYCLTILRETNHTCLTDRNVCYQAIWNRKERSK